MSSERSQATIERDNLELEDNAGDVGRHIRAIYELNVGKTASIEDSLRHVTNGFLAQPNN